MIPRLTPDRLFGLGVVSLAFAVVVVLVPVPGRDLVAPVVDRTAVHLLSVLAVVAVVRAFRNRPNRRRERGVRWEGDAGADGSKRGADGSIGLGGFDRGEPERVQREAYWASRADFAAALTAASGGDWSEVRASGRQQVRRRLESLAVDAVAESEGIDRAAAAARVADGSWTERRRAAVLLGDDVVPLAPSVRLLDWASGRPFGRQVDAAVVEIAERAGVETEVSAP